MSKICKKRVHGNEKMNLPCAFKKCTGSLHFTLLIWTPQIGESLDAQIEPNNPVDKYVVFIQKVGKVVGHLKEGVAGRFKSSILFYLKGDPYSKAKAITSGRNASLVMVKVCRFLSN